MLYLDRMEIERVTRHGTAARSTTARRHRSGSIAMSGDGRRLAFVSIASNLFFGDAQRGRRRVRRLARRTRTRTADRATGEPPFDDIGTPREDTDQRASPGLPVSVQRARGSALRVTVQRSRPARWR